MIIGASLSVHVLEMFSWSYPLLIWGGIAGALGRALQWGAGGRGPAWLPLALGSLVILPLGDFPVARWIHGYCANLSIPLAIWLLHVVITPLLPRPLLDERSQRKMAWFAFLIGLALYPAALGLGSVDPYVLGWRSWGIVLGFAFWTAILLLRRDPFGHVLLLSGIAWQLGVLESNNAWDYVVDPVLWAISVVILIHGGFDRAMLLVRKTEPVDWPEALPARH
jgi:hypothetical protein